MAHNLARSDHDLVVWNRTRKKTESLENVEVADSPLQAAEGADLIITMLSGDDAVEAVVLGDDGTAAAAAEGSTHASMTTISADCSRRLATAHAQRGQRYVAAPVFGRPDMAEKAALRIVAAGADDAIDACRPAFDLLGQEVIHVGADPQLANVMKLAGNFMLAAAIEAMAEAYTLVRAHGIDTGMFHATMAGKLFASPIYQGYGGMIEGRRYEPAGFALEHGLKDVRYALRAADEAAVPMPFGSALHDRLLSAMARGWGEADWAALGRVTAADAGDED
jgi:3-hydroxyisobutyrate dehydrogenase-like beta-hydroxyacid dehydrogenase